MPHSSGGGSSFGSHSGGSGSSGARTSRRYFSGCRTFVYYSNMVPHYVYSDSDLRKGTKKSTKIITACFIGIFIAVMCFALISQILGPSKITGTENYTVEIIDEVGVLGDTSSLKSVLDEFKSTTGITPAVHIIKDEAWLSYNSLERYAYSDYIARYSDETHWLLVFSVGSSSSDWHFEGMQGDNTDSILLTSKTDGFNSSLVSYMNMGTYSISEAITLAFKGILPNIMAGVADSSEYLPLILIIIVLIAAFVSTLFGDKLRGYKAEDLTEVVGNTEKTPKTVKCEYCGGTYTAGIHNECPHCGAPVPQE